MTLAEFLKHFRLTENPFRGEEARSDPVFARMRGEEETTGRPADTELLHADFEKILGDLRRPASAVVFGEKGSGKTAIRLQIARRIELHNIAHPGARVLLVPYDDLNSVLDRIRDRVGGKTALESLQKIRLVDHLDAVLSNVVPRLTDALLGEGGGVELPDEPRQLVRRLDVSVRRDLLVLQALYDRPDSAPERTVALRRRLRFLPPLRILSNNAALAIFPLIIAGALFWSRHWLPPQIKHIWAAWGLVGLTGLYTIFALKVGVWDRLKVRRTSRRLRRQIRVSARRDVSYARRSGNSLLKPGTTRSFP